MGRRRGRVVRGTSKILWVQFALMIVMRVLHGDKDGLLSKRNTVSNTMVWLLDYRHPVNCF